MANINHFLGCLAVIGLVACYDTDNQQDQTAVHGVAPKQSRDWQESVSKKPAFIIDTDMAIDDWVAILYLLENPDIDVPLISVTGAGEAYCEQGMRNALYLIRLAGREGRGTAVACGDSEPMDGFNVFPQAWRDDVNSLYGLGVPDDLPTPSKRHAVAVLAETIAAQPNRVSIVTLGNLTNIGQLLQQHPGIESGIKRLYVMGGAVRVGGNIIVPGFTDDNKNPVSEWNLYVDPLAAKLVINSNIAKVLVPLDATNQVQVTDQFAALFKQRALSNSSRFIDKVLDRNKGFISSGEYYFWDPLTAVYALHPEICATEELLLDVLYEPKDLKAGEGNTRGDYSPVRKNGERRRDLNPYNSGRTVVVENGMPVSVCMIPNPELFKQLLVDGLNRNRGSRHE